MRLTKKIYQPLCTERKNVVMEEGFCAGSSVIKKDVAENGDISINEQSKGADGTEFEIEF